MLNRRILGCKIHEVELRDPLVLRRPTAETFRKELRSRIIQETHRYGKFLLLHFTPPARLIINFMLTGRLTLQPSSDRVAKKMGFRLGLNGGLDLRYLDLRSMGKVYLLLDEESTALVPTFDDQGPDALDPSLTLEVFRRRFRRFRGMIKNVLLNQRFLAGLGNAYADEILYAARVNPFRKRSSLTDQEIEALYQALKSVLRNAITIITTRSGDNLRFEIRDFLQVHGKGGLPCPRCGTTISSVKSGLRVAQFCRHCQD